MSKSTGELIATAVGAFVLIVGLVVGLSLLMAYPVKWAVNWLFAPGFLTYVFGTAKIGFWQAYVLNFVCGALFKSMSTGKSSS